MGRFKLKILIKYWGEFMKLLKFEFKKMLKHKKIIWLVIILFLFISSLFSLNSFQRSRLQGNWAMYTAIDEFTALHNESASKFFDLLSIREERQLDYIEENQITHIRDMTMLLARVRTFLFMERWEEINELKKRFLIALENYENYQGEFLSLQGMEREIAKEKNAWLIKNNITFEVEESPVNPQLFLTQISRMLFSLFGIAILLLLFGNTITQEKEQKTWLTIKTQPASKAKLIFSKYITCLFSIIVFMGLALSIGFLIPHISQNASLNLQYPQILLRENSYEMISTGEYLSRRLILFFCVSSIIFSLALLVSKLVNKTSHLFFWVGSITFLSFLETKIIQSAINPLKGLLQTQNVDIPYLILTFSWILFFILISVYVPDREMYAGNRASSKRPFASGKIVIRKRVIADVCSFEWRKLWREGFLVIISISLLIIVVVGHLFLKQQTELKERSYLNELEYRLFVVNERLLGDDHIRERIDDIRLRHRLEAAIKAYEAEDWKDFYDYQILKIRNSIEETFPMGASLGRNVTIGRFTKQVSLDRKIWLSKRNIRPVLPGEFIPTIHQRWGSNTRIGWGGQMVRQPQWERENKKIDNNGLFSLYLAYTHYLYLIPIALLLIAIGGGVGKEKGKKRTFDFLKIQPFSERDVYMGKLLNAFFIALVTLILFVFLIVLIGTLLNRFGDWDYPILHYKSFRTIMEPDYSGLVAGGRGYSFITLIEYLGFTSLLLVSFSFFVISFTLLLSLIIKNTSAVLLSSVLILVIGYWRNWRKGLRINHTSPFTYFDIPRIVDGQLASITNNPQINVFTGLLVLTSFTILFIGLSFGVIYRQKIIELSLKLVRLLQKKFKKGNSIDESI